MYIKIKNGVIEKYPYTLGDLHKDNPNTSFPSDIPDEILQEFGVYRVEQTACPEIGIDKDLQENIPILENGVWKQVWAVVDIAYEEHLNRIRQIRAKKYPPAADYLDGIVKGDQNQIQQYIDACLAVKAQYPKP